MSGQVLLNNVSTKLTSQLLTGGTTANVTAGDGALFASATGGNYIRATLAKISGFKEIAWEVVYITARSTDALTITRAREGTTALQFEIGDTLSVRMTAKTRADVTNIWCGTAGGTANALTLTPATPILAYEAGMVFIGIAGASSNTGATTAAVSGLGTIAVQQNGAACVGNEIVANRPFMLVLDTTTTAQVTALGAAAGGNVAADTHAATSKATPVDADEIPLVDSAASWVLKKLTWANLKTTLGGTFAALAGSASQDFAVKKLTVSQTEGIVGTTTNNSAQAGSVGEYVESVVSGISAATSGQYGDLTSISLTAGDWDVSILGQFASNGATVTDARFGLGTATGNSSTGVVTGDTMAQFTQSLTGNVTLPIPPKRVSISATTTYYLKMFSSYTVATPVCSGRISARRVR